MSRRGYYESYTPGKNAIFVMSKHINGLLCFRILKVNLSKAKRKVQVSIIDSIKGDYGFIVNEDGDDGKNLFFHSSNLIEVKMGDLTAGDTVSFSLIHNK